MQQVAAALFRTRRLRDLQRHNVSNKEFSTRTRRPASLYSVTATLRGFACLACSSARLTLAAGVPSIWRRECVHESPASQHRLPDGQHPIIITERMSTCIVRRSASTLAVMLPLDLEPNHPHSRYRCLRGTVCDRRLNLR